MSQVFKKIIPSEKLFEFLEKICIKNNNYYLLNKSAFNKSKLLNILEKWCNDIKDYYHISRSYYITRKLDYKKFITIIRQICNKNQIPYNSKIVYSKSNYEIIFHIYSHNFVSTL